MLLKEYRKLQTYLLLITLVVLAFSFYLEYVKNLDPCLLCLAQRAAVIAISILALITIIFRYLPKLFLFSQLSFALLGITLASRQIWLQNIAHKAATACVPNLDILIKYFSLQDILKTIFAGSPDCGDVKWTLFNISLAGYANIYFLCVALYISFILYKTYHE